MREILYFIVLDLTIFPERCPNGLSLLKATAVGPMLNGFQPLKQKEEEEEEEEEEVRKCHGKQEESFQSGQFLTVHEPRQDFKSVISKRYDCYSEDRWDCQSEDRWMNRLAAYSAKSATSIASSHVAPKYTISTYL
ncbi:unnamed protein product [Dovyalis caffra]|uniref:Uncharacterized protein n=1 Tax=Dovyalis caffra TaxID=77055 RepID=A0AAV1R0P3_9ROSI|nr:unnamed protein product [Dovyalis caffra]